MSESKNSKSALTPTVFLVRRPRYRDVRRGGMGGSIPPPKIKIPEGGYRLNNFHKLEIMFFYDRRPFKVVNPPPKKIPADVPASIRCQLDLQNTSVCGENIREQNLQPKNILMLKMNYLQEFYLTPNTTLCSSLP
jgi:hypothetical protein